MQRSPRIHDDAHLAYLRTLNCLICGDNTSTEAAHIRMSDARIGKVNSGVGAKPHDFYCLPLCGQHHRLQHSTGNERKFWQELEIDPILISLALYAVSGNYERGCQIIAVAQREPANILAAG